MNNSKKKIIPSVIFAIAAILIFTGLFLFTRSTEEEDNSQRESYTIYSTAKVIQVLSDTSVQEPLYENQYVGTQVLMIKFTSNTYKDMTMTAENYLSSLYGTRLKAGDSVVVATYISAEEIISNTVYEYNKIIPICILVGVFFLLTILIGGKKGAQSLLGLVITIITTVFILMPLLIKGAPTILTTLLLCLYVAAVSFFLLDGLSKKSVAAMLGTALGLGFAALFGLFAQAITKVDGMRMGEYLDGLLQLKFAGGVLKLRGLLLAGMLIAALGAIMDVAMSISSALNELVSVNPKLSVKELIRSGMNIGRDMIGTMTNTLILAFVGSSFIMVLYIYSQNYPAVELFSSNLVTTQVIHSLASSVGVILSVPVTVVISAFIYANSERSK